MFIHQSLLIGQINNLPKGGPSALSFSLDDQLVFSSLPNKTSKKYLFKTKSKQKEIKKVFEKLIQDVL